jgi:hypothetical protein
MLIKEEIRFAGDHVRPDDKKTFRFEGSTTSLHAHATVFGPTGPSTFLEVTTTEQPGDTDLLVANRARSWVTGLIDRHEGVA